MRRALVVSLLVGSLLVVSLAHAQAPPVDWATTSASTLTYHLVHKLHRVDGVSRRVEGRARLAPDGAVQVMVRVPADSFESGNVNRDAHAKEVLEAGRYPFVVLKASGAASPPPKFPASEERTFQAQLSLHGVEQASTLPVTLHWDAPGRVRVSARFAVSLEHFKIERPALLFVKVDDEVWIEADLVFQR